MTEQDMPERMDVRDWPNVTIEHDTPSDDKLVPQPLRVYPPTQRRLLEDAAAQGVGVSVVVRKIIEAHYEARRNGAAQAGGDVVTIKRDALLKEVEQAVNRAIVSPPHAA